MDLFAPGVDIYSACGSETRCDIVDDTSYTFASGTSMATPHVAGVAALYLQANPKASPQDVSAALVAAATTGAVDSSGFKPGTSNRLLYSRIGAPSGVQAVDGP